MLSWKETSQKVSQTFLWPPPSMVIDSFSETLLRNTPFPEGI
jgi:hypothetical protein